MKNFVRVKEDFVCLRCSEKVRGDGYTDHCPKCLWGKHVDETIPGDRKSRCRGLMRPVMASYEKGEIKLNYKCEKCKHEFWVKSAKNDDREKLLEMVAGINRG